MSLRKDINAHQRDISTTSWSRFTDIVWKRPPISTIQLAKGKGCHPSKSQLIFPILPYTSPDAFTTPLLFFFFFQWETPTPIYHLLYFHVNTIVYFFKPSLVPSLLCYHMLVKESLVLFVSLITDISIKKKEPKFSHFTLTH